MSRVRLAGRIRVALPSAEAFRLFTPHGERDWAAGWDPRFPAPAPDDTEPGIVFETDAHGATTTWVVLDRWPGRRVRYARVTPGRQAGIVEVTIEDRDGHSDVEVVYTLTALTPAAVPGLEEFARGYPAYLRSWQEAIASAVGGSGC